MAEDNEIMVMSIGDGESVHQCCDCGGYSLVSVEEIRHHGTYVPGEAKKWQEFYENAEEEIEDDGVY